MPKKESHLRSILKAFSWRIVATATTTTIAFFLTGSASAALAIGSIEFFAKIPVYYGHERLWQTVPLGEVRSAAAALSQEASVQNVEVVESN